MENREVFGENAESAKNRKNIINDNDSGYRKDGITRIGFTISSETSKYFCILCYHKNKKIKYVRRYCNVKTLGVRE